MQADSVRTVQMGSLPGCFLSRTSGIDRPCFERYSWTIPRAAFRSAPSNFVWTQRIVATATSAELTAISILKSLPEFMWALRHERAEAAEATVAILDQLVRGE